VLRSIPPQAWKYLAPAANRARQATQGALVMITEKLGFILYLSELRFCAEFANWIPGKPRSLHPDWYINGVKS